MLDLSDVATFVGTLRSHQNRLLAGLDAEAFADELAVASALARPALLFDLSVGGDAATIVEGAVARLARLVADLWPFLWGGEDFSGARDDALTRAHLPLRAAELAHWIPGLSAAWAVAAMTQLLRGLPPRVTNAPPSLEWAQLVLAFCPTGLTMVAASGPGIGEAWVQAVEWLAGHGEVAAVVLAEDDADEPALQRIAFGARRAVLAACGSVPGISSSSS